MGRTIIYTYKLTIGFIEKNENGPGDTYLVMSKSFDDIDECMSEVSRLNADMKDILYFFVSKVFK